MKPRALKCRLYCDLYDGCKREECNRSVLFKGDRIIMVEPSIANYHRGKEKLRAYRESRETYVNN